MRGKKRPLPLAVKCCISELAHGTIKDQLEKEYLSMKFIYFITFVKGSMIGPFASPLKF